MEAMSSDATCLATQPKLPRIHSADYSSTCIQQERKFERSNREYKESYPQSLPLFLCKDDTI